MGERLASAIPGDIAELLKSYIALDIDLRMKEAVFPMVNSIATETAGELIEQKEATKADISMIIYSYGEVE